MGQWTEYSWEREYLEKLKKLFDETQEKLIKDHPDKPITFEEFVVSLDVTDKVTKKIFECLVKETILHSHSSAGDSGRSTTVPSFPSSSPTTNAVTSSVTTGSNSISGSNGSGGNGTSARTTLLFALPISSMQSGATILIPANFLSSSANSSSPSASSLSNNESEVR